MASGPIKAASESDVTPPDGEPTLDFDEDTLRGRGKR